MHFTRFQMYNKIFNALPLPLEGSILGISGLKYWVGSPHYKPDREIISEKATVKEVDYPTVDIQSLPFQDNTFDYVICDQVLEHVEGNIEKAVEEVRRVLKPNGIAIFSSPFLYPIHYGPKDLWRFSKDGYRYLCRNYSKIITCDSWGNRWVHALFFLYDKARDWKVSKRKTSPVKFLATYNEPAYPLLVWIIAKK